MTRTGRPATSSGSATMRTQIARPLAVTTGISKSMPSPVAMLRCSACSTRGRAAAV